MLSQEEKLERLRTIIPFVVDNSLRETSVVQIRGHTVIDKDIILESLKPTGIQHIIVGTFDFVHQVDDEWLKIKQK